MVRGMIEGPGGCRLQSRSALHVHFTEQGEQDGALISSCHGKMLIKKGTYIFCHGRVVWLSCFHSYRCSIFLAFSGA